MSFALSATDSDNDALTFSATGLPQGSSFNSAGQFSWTPTSAQSGAYAVTFAVADSRGASDSETITITVNDVLAPIIPPAQIPVLSVPDVVRASEGERVVIAATVFNTPTSMPITFTIDNPLFTKQGSSGTFVWQTDFDDEGTYYATITALAQNGWTQSKRVTVIIRDRKIIHQKVRINNAVAMNEKGIVEQGAPLQLYLDIENIGNSDDEATRVTVLIPELDVFMDLGRFNLDSGSNYLDLVDVSLGSKVIAGKEYYFIVRADIDDESDLKYGSFIASS